MESRHRSSSDGADLDSTRAGVVTPTSPPRSLASSEISCRDRPSQMTVCRVMPPKRSAPSSHRRALVVFSLGVGLFAGACSSADDEPDAIITTTTTSTTGADAPAGSTTTSTDDASPDAEVLAGYRRFWDAYLAAADPMDPTHPDLEAGATGAQLERVQRAFLARQASGEVIRGSLDLAPEVAEVDGTTATVTDCYADDTHIFDEATGEQKDSPGVLSYRVTATLELVDGTWKVADLVQEGEGCESA